MGNSADQQRINSLIREGLRQLRAGKVSAALTHWGEALTLDEANTTAQDYIEYIKKNRIRIAVHLGRTPPTADQPIQIPDGWSDPPEGLCDVVEDEPVPPEVDAVEDEPVPPEVDAVEDEPVPPEDDAVEDEPVPPEDDAVEDEPVPPEVDAVEDEPVPPEDDAVEDEPVPPEDDAVEDEPVPPEDDDADSTQDTPPVQPRPVAKSTGHLPYAEVELTGASRPRLSDVLAKGKKKPSSSAGPKSAPPAPRPLAPTTDNTEAQRHRSPPRSPTGDDYLTMEIVVEDDEPTSDRPEPLSLETLADTSDNTPSGSHLPAAEPEGEAASTPLLKSLQSPRVATTFDEVGSGKQTDAEPSARRAPGSVQELSPYTTLAGLGPRVLFAEFGDTDQPLQAPPLDFAPPVGEDPVPIQLSEGPLELDREEQSFSEELPTDARPSTMQVGSGVIAEPGDHSPEGSFSDLIPSTTPLDRDDSEAGFRAMPPNQDEPLPDDQDTGDRSAARTEDPLDEENKALLHPDQGLAQAKQLIDAGEYEQSLHLTEQLLERYPTLAGLSDLLETSRDKLGASVLAKLGDLEAICVPQTTDLGQDNQAMDPKAAYLFSRIDGTMSLQDIIDISGMSEFESARLLLLLHDIGLLDFEPPR
jgi:hypothetical protein